MAEISIAYRNGMVVAKPLSDDEEEEGPGRILTVEEFVDRLRNRTDIFGVDKNHRLRNIEVITLLFALVAGMFTSQVKSLKIGTDFYMPKPMQKGLVTMRGDISITRPPMAKPDVQKPSAVKTSNKRPLHYNRNPVANPSSVAGPTGGGSIRSRVSASGVLGIITGRIRGRDAADGDFLGKGGFAEGINAIISGVHGLKQGGSSAASRLGAQGIGYGPGYHSGFNGDGPGGVDGLINSLMQPTEPDAGLTLKTGPPDRITRAAITPVQQGIRFNGSGRSRVDIMRVVMQNLSALRYSYNQRLRERPGLSGRITIKFAVDEFGKVIACEVVESNMNDQTLESAITGKILRWNFDRIDKPGDITEVVYPFVFST
jgi:hypothetical protein